MRSITSRAEGTLIVTKSHLTPICRPVCNCKRFNLFQPSFCSTFLFYHNLRQNARIFCKGWGFCACRLSCFYGAETITLRAVLAAWDYASVVCVHSPYGIPRRECEHQASHSQERLNFTEFPMSKRKPQFKHCPKSSSFRNLSSNEVRCKFREREKVEITVPTKPDAKKSRPGACVYGVGSPYYLG